jgi:adenylyltransferase/sulfurtransferase
MKRRSAATLLCGRNSVQVVPMGDGDIDLGAFARKLGRAGKATLSEHMLTVKLPAGRVLTLFRDGRAIIKGTTDEKIARSLYSRYVGT